MITDPNFDAQYAERWPHYHDFHKKKVLGAEENYLSYLWYEAFPKFTIPWMTLTIQALNWGVYYWMLDYAKKPTAKAATTLLTGLCTNSDVRTTTPWSSKTSGGAFSLLDTLTSTMTMFLETWQPSFSPPCSWSGRLDPGLYSTCSTSRTFSETYLLESFSLTSAEPALRLRSTLSTAR